MNYEKKGNIQYSDDEKTIIWLDSFENFSYAFKQELLEAASEPKFLVKNFADFKEIIENNTVDYDALKKTLTKKYFDDLLNFLSDRNITAVTYKSELYPAELKEHEDFPLVLYCMGNSELLQKDKICIVGSRICNDYAYKKTVELSERLSRHFVIVTGIAEGIDAAAIKGALDSGNLISVQAGGFKEIYPPENKNLFEKIIRNALAITEYPYNIKTQPHHFPIRNRILAAISQATVVTSAKQKSGALITASQAFEYGKDVFSLPYAPNVITGEGCNNLIKQGAKLMQSADDITEFYGIAADTAALDIAMSDEEKAIYEILKEQSTHIDIIAEKTGIAPADLNASLNMLELNGLIIRDSGNKYCIKK